ncbi:MAG: ABC transporter permease [Gemmatimonadota bacterium]|nr:ABC transporter permease [Gemmatimonadota bacterium]
MTRLRTVLAEFWQDVRAQKVRTVLTVLGITWGTVAVVVLLAFGTGLERATLKRFHGLGDRVVMLFGGTTTRPFRGFADGRTIRLREEDARVLVRQVPEIERISPEYSRRGTPVRNGRAIVNPNITGVWPDYTWMRNVIPDWGGRFLNEADVEGRRRVVVLGDRVRELLFEGETGDVVGRTVLIGATPFTVVGVMRPKNQSSSYNSRDRDRVFIPASTHRAMFGDVYVNNIVYQTGGPEASQRAERAVREVLGGRYRFDPTDDDALGVWDTTEFEKMFGYLFLSFHIFFAIVGSFTLTVGGIGVANIMYVVVRERTPEIGIRRSVGARKSDILRQFFLESTVLVLAGGGIGFALSLLLVRSVRFGDMEEFIGVPVVSPTVALVTVSLLGLIAFLAGWFPARRAANLDPVECLRH